MLFAVGQAVAFQVCDLSILNDTHRQPDQFLPGHLVAHGVVHVLGQGRRGGGQARQQAKAKERDGKTNGSHGA